MKSLSDCKDHIQALISLLKDETNRIRQGDLSLLDEYSKIKLEGLKNLDVFMKSLSKPEEKNELAPFMARLSKVSSENGALLKGLYVGSKAAQAKIVELKEQQSSVGVYGHKGQKLSLSNAGVLKEKTV